MHTAFTFAVILVATACIAVGQIPAELPLVRPRVTVKSIPPFQPDGQPVPAVPPTIPGHPLSSPTGPPLVSGLLAWDGDEKAATVTFGAAQASFIFQVSNVSPGPVTITSVQSSCGCEAAPDTVDAHPRCQGHHRRGDESGRKKRHQYQKPYHQH